MRERALRRRLGSLKIPVEGLQRGLLSLADQQRHIGPAAHGAGLLQKGGLLREIPRKRPCPLLYVCLQSLPRVFCAVRPGHFQHGDLQRGGAPGIEDGSICDVLRLQMVVIGHVVRETGLPGGGPLKIAGAALRRKEGLRHLGGGPGRLRGVFFLSAAGEDPQQGGQDQ